MDIRIINARDVARCPITSLDRDHYRDDGTCLCVATNEADAPAG